MPGASKGFVPGALALDEALNITSAARLVTTGEAPYTIIHTNKAWHDITGWKFTEVAGQTCRLLQGPATGGPALEALHKGLRTRTPVKTELVNYTRAGNPIRVVIECAPVTSGTHFYATITAKPIADGSVAPIPAQPARVPVPIVNCAERHRDKRSRREPARTRLTDVLANTTDPIVLCAKEYPHVITHPNQPWLEMCGYTLEEVEGMTNNILTGPETDPSVIADLLDCVRREVPSLQTLVNYKKGGARFINEVKTRPVYDDDDQLAGFMSMLREVGE